MNERRYEALTKWLETHRERVDVERGVLISQDGTHAVGSVTKTGYLTVRVGGSAYNLHEVIAVAGGLDLRGLTVNHMDGNKRNNALSNLEAVTTAQNTQHAYVTGLLHHPCGEDWALSKLTWDDVRAIRAKYAAGGVTQRALAAMYGVHPSNISKITLGNSWRETALPLAS